MILSVTSLLSKIPEKSTMTYHQLAYEQRCQIYTLKSTGMSQKAIAMRISVSPSTICQDELNAALNGYY